MRKKSISKLLYFYLFIYLCQALAVACGIQFPDQELNLVPLYWKHGVLATGPPGKSLYPQYSLFIWSFLYLPSLRVDFEHLRGENHILLAFKFLVPRIEFVCVCASHSVVSDSSRPHGLQPTRCFCPQNSLGKNTRVGCHALLQGIFPTQRSNQCLLCLLRRQGHLYHWCHLGSPIQGLLN